LIFSHKLHGPPLIRLILIAIMYIYLGGFFSANIT
jgi:hypothetical protein